jgi:predicted Na+-dependent transporter
MPIEDLEEKRKRINNTALKYFGLFMALAWIVLGIVIINMPDHMLNITVNQKTLLGVLFLLYGLYRAVRVYWQYFRKRV